MRGGGGEGAAYMHLLKNEKKLHLQSNWQALKGGEIHQPTVVAPNAGPYITSCNFFDTSE